MQERRHHEHVGAGGVPDQRRGLDAGLDHVPIDREAMDGGGVRQQSDPIPLGQDLFQRPGLLEGLPHGQQSAAGREQPHHQLARLLGPRLGDRHTFAHQSSCRRRGEHHVSFGRLGRCPQQQQRVLPRSRSGIQNDLPRGDRDAGRHAQQRGASYGRRRGGSLDNVSCPPPRQPGEVGHSTTEFTHPELGGECIGGSHAASEVHPHLRADPVGRSTRQGVHDVADVKKLLATALQIGMRYVDQPGRDQCLEHDCIAQAALCLLDVRDRRMRQLTDHLVTLAHQRAQRGQLRPGVAAPLRQHLGPQPQGEVGIARQVPDVEQAERDPQILLGRLGHLSHRSHRVIQLGAGVPQRIPDHLAQVLDQRGRCRVKTVAMHEHDVEIGVRRQLAPAVASDRDKSSPDVGTRTSGVGADAQGVRLGGPLCTISGGHRTPTFLGPGGWFAG